MKGRFEGKVVLITGAASGIGAATARRFAREGARLMLGDIGHPEGTDPEYGTAFFDVYGEMLRKSVAWPALGDRDALSADSSTQSGIYYDVFTVAAAGEAGGVVRSSALQGRRHGLLSIYIGAASSTYVRSDFEPAR